MLLVSSGLALSLEAERWEPYAEMRAGHALGGPQAGGLYTVVILLSLVCAAVCVWPKERRI